MKRLRNLKVGLRLGVGFGLVCVLLIVVLATGLWGAASQRRSEESIVEHADLSARVLQLKFRAADLNGWQTTYAFEAERGAPRATDDSVGSRQAFISSAAAFEAELAAIESITTNGSVDEQEALAGVRRDHDRFMAGDDRIVALYREGSTASSDEATDLVLGHALVLFKAVAEGTDRLAQAVAEDSDRAHEAGATAAARARRLMLVVGALALSVATLLAVVITRSVTVPLRRTIEVLRAVVRGDLTVRVESTTGDEVGQMGRALNETLDTMQTTVDSIAAGSATLSSSSEELSAVSQEMSAMAEETAVQAASVSAAAEQVSNNLQSVSTGAEELDSSVQEIARNTSDAAAVASRAVAVAGATDDMVRKLGASSSEIGEVIKVITSIAEQTNLLALNATIEAARAGEAGKGFAVVANEVKDLARRTARASEEIAQKIETIQGDSRQAVEAIAEITAIIGQIDDIQVVIAASVEEQAATTSEIGRSVTEAAEGSSEIARNITGVAESARSATQASAETHRSAEDLAALASELLTLVGQFDVGATTAPSRVPVAALAENGAAPGGRRAGSGTGSGGDDGSAEVARRPATLLDALNR